MPRRDALIAGLLALSLAVLLLPFARQGIDPHHDGIMLKPALDVLSGQVLFRDTFSQYGALTTYLQAAALWFQPTLLVLRCQTVAAYAVTLFFLYAAWRMILPRSLTVLSCGFFLLFIPAYEKNWLDQYWILHPWSSVFAMMFQAIGLYALFRMIAGEQSARWGFLLGAVCACAFWCRQPVGILMAVCLVATWLALCWTNWAPTNQSRRSVLAGIVGGFGAVHVGLLGGILFSGAGPEWWYQNFIWPRKMVSINVNMDLHDFLTVFVHPRAGLGLLLLFGAAAAPRLANRFWPGLPGRVITGYYFFLGLVLLWQYPWTLHTLALRDGGWTALLPVVVVLQGIASLTLIFTARNPSWTYEYHLVGGFAALSLGSLLQYYPLPDSWHILWSLGPTFGLAVFVFWRGLGWPAPVLALVLTAALLPSVYAKARLAASSLTRPMVTLSAPAVLRGMQVPPEQAKSYERITEALARIQRHQPDLPAALVGNDALFLCFTLNRANPTPYYVTWIGLADNAANLKRLNYIQSVRPMLFLIKADWVAVGDFYRRARYVPLLYIHEEALELAVPQEIADALGVTTYGAPQARTPPR